MSIKNIGSWVLVVAIWALAGYGVVSLATQPTSPIYRHRLPKVEKQSPPPGPEAPAATEAAPAVAPAAQAPATKAKPSKAPSERPRAVVKAKGKTVTKVIRRGIDAQTLIGREISGG